MSDTILVAVITGSVTLFGTILSNLMTHSKTMFRIEQLEHKVEKHNNFIERLYIAESKICVLEDKQKNIDDDIDLIKKTAMMQ